MTDQRHATRYPTAQPGKLTLTILPFENESNNIDVKAVVTDVAETGLGVSAHRNLEPGYVTIKDDKGLYTHGVLVWSKKLNDMTYRAGIQFLLMVDKAA